MKRISGVATRRFDQYVLSVFMRKSPNSVNVKTTASGLVLILLTSHHRYYKIITMIHNNY